jgi:glycine hydroxymethyltransferase
MVSGGTENHMVLLDLREFDEDLTGKVAQEVLDRAGITTNRNTIPDDPAQSVRHVGSSRGQRPRETTAGMKEGEFETIASLMARALRQRDDDSASCKRFVADVAALCASFNPYANFSKLARWA